MHNPMPIFHVVIAPCYNAAWLRLCVLPHTFLLAKVLNSYIPVEKIKEKNPTHPTCVIYPSSGVGLFDIPPLCALAYINHHNMLC
jgi:hypothetical protein